MRKTTKIISTVLAASLVLPAQVPAAVSQNTRLETVTKEDCSTEPSARRQATPSNAESGSDADRKNDGNSRKPQDADPASGTSVSAGTIVINEIDTSSDWVEITNIGTEEVDLTGWFITDDKGLERFDENKTTPLIGISLKPGAFIVLKKDQNFTFGLGISWISTAMKVKQMEAGRGRKTEALLTLNPLRTLPIKPLRQSRKGQW